MFFFLFSYTTFLRLCQLESEISIHKDINFTTLQAGEGFTIQTSALAEEDIQAIQEALETAAVYKIVGDED